MSITLMSKVWDLPLDTPSQKLVMLSLADQSNDDGVCWPSIGTTARRAGVSVRAVAYAIEQLEEAGHLTRNQRPGRSTYYTVHPRHDVTPATAAPLQPLQTTPATVADPPLQPLQTEPSVEPSRNRERGSRAKSNETRATRLTDFPLTPERRQAAETEKVDADREHAKFLDYWHAASGSAARKVDWDATWRNWCRRAGEMTRSRPGHPYIAPTKRTPPTEAEMQAARRAAAEANRRELERTVGNPTPTQQARRGALSEALSQIGRLP